MGAYKKFNDQLYADNDTQACNAVLSYINSMGTYAVRNDDRYGPDIVVYAGFKPSFYAEAEIKRVWKPGTEFQWGTVQLPERKAKFIGTGFPIEFWILRADLKAALVIPESSIYMERLVEISNVHIASGELFFQIPVGECILVEL